MIDIALVVGVVLPVALAVDTATNKPTRPTSLTAAQRRDANIARLERELEIGD